MNDVTDEEIVSAMEMFGGGFVEALAVAIRRADKINLQILKIAFPAYWREYAKIAADQKLRINKPTTQENRT